MVCAVRCRSNGRSKVGKFAKWRLGRIKNTFGIANLKSHLKRTKYRERNHFVVIGVYEIVFSDVVVVRIY